MMPYLSITRLKLKSPYYLVPFLIQTEQVVTQIKTSGGFLQGKLLATLDLSMWTATLWRSEQELRSFYLGGAHREVMARLSEWASEATSGHQGVLADFLPSWSEIGHRLEEVGHFSSLRNPSANHRNQFISPPSPAIFVRRITPVRSAPCKP